MHLLFTQYIFRNRKVLFLWCIKKGGRLPPAYFAPSLFGEDAILKDENFFSQKKHFFLINFSSFSNVQSFRTFFVKKTYLERKRHVQIIAFHTHFKASLLPLAILKIFKTLSQKKLFLKKDRKFWELYYFHRIRQQSCCFWRFFFENPIFFC